MKATHVGKYFVSYDDGTCWPRAGTDLEYHCRYSAPQALTAASFVSAFEALVWMPRRRRDEVIAAIRANASDEGGG